MLSFRMLAAAVTLAGTAVAADPAPDFRPYTRPVMTWVPPYAVARSQVRLEAGGDAAAAALTHVGLQFWAPTAQGGVEVVARYDHITPEAVKNWREWCHTRGVRALLCVYNGVEKWDWGLARSAFALHREEFVQALLAELDRTGLDGIDIDLEGNGDWESDKATYLEFLTALSTAVHGRGKQLFVDTFPYIWNAPNRHWWPQLFPLVDGLTAMGYEETGSASPGWRAYAALGAAAGQNESRLLIGLPTHLARWEGRTLGEHLQSLAAKPGPGVALWDAQFPAPAWNGTELWRLLRRVQEAPAAP